MKRISKILIICGILSILTAISLIVINKYEDYEAGILSDNVISKIEENIITINKEEEKTLEIDGNNYLGIIEIPRLNLRLPVMSEFSYDKLRISPCIYYGSITNNDLIICAHSYASHFGYLSMLEQGDIILITDINNNVYAYEVLVKEVLDSKSVSEMINNDFDLTLYTCSSSGLERITIRANRLYDKNI